MTSQRLFSGLFCLILLLFKPTQAKAGEWFASWGYSREYWAPSDIHVSQPDLGNDFTVHQVKATDYPQWSGSVIFGDPSSAQFNFRVGRFFDDAKDYALEFNFDHTKYTSVPDQIARVTGTVDHQSVDSDEILSDEYFHYWLHNGVNHIMLNLVRRWSVLGVPKKLLSVALIAKAGGGIVLPHASNRIMGNELDVGQKKPGHLVGTREGWWQLNGWAAGIEAGLRWTLWQPVYLEFTAKEAYAKLAGVPVFEGRADQALTMTEVVISAGYTLD